MARAAALALIIGTLCGAATSRQVAEFSSYYSGNRYDFRLTHKQRVAANTTFPLAHSIVFVRQPRQNVRLLAGLWLAQAGLPSFSGPSSSPQVPGSVLQAECGEPRKL